MVEVENTKTLRAALADGHRLILHGPLGTELEAEGFDISGSLWSARILIESPEAVEKIHEKYLRLGADVITTASYQATMPGLRAVGYSQARSQEIIRASVRLAAQARQAVWSTLTEEEQANRLYPLIGGDVGPYAALLADGSEYTGDYGAITVEELKDFHRERISLLLEEGADFLCIETIPNRDEARALVELLSVDFPQTQAYISFTAQTGTALSDGTPVHEVVRVVDQCEQIVAIGFNCTSPDLYDELLSAARDFTDKPLVAYPNAGEHYDGETQTWVESGDRRSLVEDHRRWAKYGVALVGGCCRTNPEDIGNLATVRDKGLLS